MTIVSFASFPDYFVLFSVLFARLGAAGNAQ